MPAINGRVLNWNLDVSHVRYSGTMLKYCFDGTKRNPVASGGILSLHLRHILFRLPRLAYRHVSPTNHPMRTAFILFGDSIYFGPVPILLSWFPHCSFSLGQSFFTFLVHLSLAKIVCFVLFLFFFSSGDLEQAAFQFWDLLQSVDKSCIF